MIDAINSRLAKSGSRLTKRGEKVIYFALAVLILIASITFGYATHDTCWVGTEHGNFLGYGSCEQMIDRVVGSGK